MNMAGSYWYNSNSIRNGEKFTVYINEGERNQIKRWVLEYDHIETGGDLFGLWIDDRTAVVQFVLGPGKKCRRTSVSFYQDIEYLREAGNYLTEKHGLCNIGQWHSHHRLGLTRPSGGDENTVWGNMPNLGLNRYIVCIATINSPYYNGKPTASMNPYLFEIKGGRRNGVLQGSFEEMKGNSPFRLDKSIQFKTTVGAEKINEIKRFVNENVHERRKRSYSETENRSTNSPESKQPKAEVDLQEFRNSTQAVEQTPAKSTTSESTSHVMIIDVTGKIYETAASTSQSAEYSAQNVEENRRLDENMSETTTSDHNQNSGLEKNRDAQSQTIETSGVGNGTEATKESVGHEQNKIEDGFLQNPQSNESENRAKDEGIQTKVVETSEHTGESFQDTQEEQKVKNGNTPETSTQDLGLDIAVELCEESENKEHGSTQNLKPNESSNHEKEESIQSKDVEINEKAEVIDECFEDKGQKMEDLENRDTPETSTQDSYFETIVERSPDSEESKNRDDGFKQSLKPNEGNNHEKEESRQFEDVEMSEQTEVTGECFEDKEEKMEESENRETPETSTQETTYSETTIERSSDSEESKSKDEGSTQSLKPNECSKDVEMGENTERTEVCFQDKGKEQEIERLDNGNTPETSTQDSKLETTILPLGEETENKIEDGLLQNPQSNESGKLAKNEGTQTKVVETSERTEVTGECFKDTQEEQNINNGNTPETSTEDSSMDTTRELREESENIDDGSTQRSKGSNKYRNHEKEEGIQSSDVEISEITEATEEFLQNKELMEEAENKKTPETSTQESNLDITIEHLPPGEESANTDDGSTENLESNKTNNREKDENTNPNDVDEQQTEETTNKRTSESSTQDSNLDITFELLPPGEDTENKDNGSTKNPKLNDSAGCGKDESIQSKEAVITIKHFSGIEVVEKNKDGGFTQNPEPNESSSAQNEDKSPKKLEIGDLDTDEKILKEADPSNGESNDCVKLKSATPLPSDTQNEHGHCNNEEDSKKESKRSVATQEIPDVSVEGDTSASLDQNGNEQEETNNSAMVSEESLEDGMDYQNKTTSGTKQLYELEQDSGPLLENGKTGDHTELIEQLITESDNRKTPETSTPSTKFEVKPSEALESHESQLSSFKTDDTRPALDSFQSEDPSVPSLNENCNKESESITLTSHEDETEMKTEIMDTDGGQLSADYKKEENELNTLQKNLNGENSDDQDSDKDETDDIVLAGDGFHYDQSGLPNIAQKDAEDDLKQNLDQNSQYNIPAIQGNDYNKTESESIEVEGPEEKENDVNVIALNEELNSPDDFDEEMPSESDDVQNNSSVQGIANQNAKLKALKQDSNPNKTQVESMDVDNEQFSSKGEARKIEKCTQNEQFVLEKHCLINLTNPNSVQKIVQDSTYPEQKEDEKRLKSTSSDTVPLKETDTPRNDDDINITELGTSVPVGESTCEQRKKDAESSFDKTADQNVDNSQANKIEVIPTIHSIKYHFVKGDVESNVTELMNEELTNSNKNNRKSCSIFDPLSDSKERNSTSEIEKNVADTMVEKEAVAQTFTEEETKHDRKDSQNEEQDLKEEYEETVKDTEIPTFVDPGMNNSEDKEIFNENQTNSGSTVMEKSVSEREKEEGTTSKEKQESIETSNMSASKDDDRAVTMNANEKSKAKDESIDVIQVSEKNDGGTENNGKKVAKGKKRKPWKKKNKKESNQENYKEVSKKKSIGGKVEKKRNMKFWKSKKKNNKAGEFKEGEESDTNRKENKSRCKFWKCT